MTMAASDSYSSWRTEVEKGLRTLPPAVLDGYRGARQAIGSVFNEEELALWAREGLTIASQTVRSWEAAAEYFRVSPHVAKHLPFPTFTQWARCGTYLAHDSPTLAMSYFRASPQIVPHLRAQYISRWAGLGRSLYKGTWKSSTLAATFFEVSPQLIRPLPFWDVEVSAALIESLSRKSYDVATECLVIIPSALCQMGREREAFLSLCRALVERNWREVKSCVESFSKAIPAIEESQRSRFLQLAEHLAKAGQRENSTFLVEGSQALNLVNSSSQRYILDLCEILVAVSPEAVSAFLKNLNAVLSRITLNQLDVWFQQGVRLLRENRDSGVAYFKIESNASEQLLDALSSSVELDRVRGIMRLYCRALSGCPVEIHSSKELVSKGIGWVSESHASTEGTKVYLPAVVDHFSSKDDNFGWFKVVSTHQVAHLEFGSFAFVFDRPSVRFKDLRPSMEDKAMSVSGLQKGQHDGSDGSSTEMGHTTDMGRFFHLFDDRRLALDIFTILEDGRLDYKVKVEYRGIIASYKQVQQGALRERPDIETLPIRQAMIELLVRFSLEQFKGLAVSSQEAKAAKMLGKIFRCLLYKSVTVEDTAEATLRAYQIISKLPNELEQPEEFQSQDLDDPGEFSEEELQELLQQLQDRQGHSEEGAKQQAYESPQDVEYRGDFKPELVQLLHRMRSDQSHGAGGEAQPITRERLEQLLRESVELDVGGEGGALQNAIGLFAQNIRKEAGAPPPSNLPGPGYGPIAHVDEHGGSLEAQEPRAQVYDEWDFRVADYKPKWCIVREKNVDEGDIRFFDDTLQNYAGLCAAVRRQFELVVPMGFNKVRRVLEGEELDLDATIEATVDRRMGITPFEKVWWRKSKQERNVAVVFLLDMSASTAEAIEEGRHSLYDHDAPDDPVDYMMWLRSRREGLVRRQYKRIIDLEKESVALLIHAIETIGDTYGIYGFSGYGRENVEFYVIKDIDEVFQDKVKRRIDRVTPLHATRMGPAIRHASSKLDPQEAKTKILFLISDGRPQDRGYSREGVEKEYAVHDTHMALVEAKRRGIIPFCLTVDKSGNDYLKTMCGDMSYEVLDNIWALPERLPMLYQMLTT